MEERSQPASGVADKWLFNFAPAVRRPRDERSHGSEEVEEASLSLLSLSLAVSRRRRHGPRLPRATEAGPFF